MGLLRKILKEVCKESEEELKGSTSLSGLCTRIQSELSKSKFLLVFDDVWELGWWMGEVADTLTGGAKESKILITSRKVEVSQVIGDKMYKLTEMSLDEIWSLFLRVAKIQEHELESHNLKGIGEKIVAKCGGLPLVVQTVGSLMCTKRMTKDDWESIDKSEIWEIHSSIFLGDTRGCNVRELKDLNKVKVIDAKNAQLKEKHELIGVKFYFEEQEDDGVDNASEERSLLEALEPPYGIERLGIYSYKGDRDVIGIKSLEELKVQNCPTLCELPSMLSLKSLEIWLCDGLNKVGDLPALESLTVSRCERLKTLANMPALESLHVYRCQRLKTLTNMPALELLEVEGCGRLEQVSDDHMPALKRLKLSYLKILKQLPTRLPSLEELAQLGNNTYFYAMLKKGEF
ncbi:disease resistance protein RPS2-like [Nymphaea colorata]|nr:disease resistance protein RPS2-like [Nymphaea colorata]